MSIAPRPIIMWFIAAVMGIWLLGGLLIFPDAMIRPWLWPLGFAIILFLQRGFGKK